MQQRFPHLLRLVLAVWLISVTGCGAGSPPPTKTPEPAPQEPATAVNAEDLARATGHLLLSKDSDRDSKLLLAGVVQHQLERAERLFEAGHAEAAEDMVIGALLLLRQHDAMDSATRGRAQALLHAAHEAARVGDTGRSSALYERTLAVSDDAQVKRDVKEHLRAMQQWLDATEADTSLQRQGERARHATSRAVVDPSSQAYEQAMTAILDWLMGALQASIGEGGPTSRAEREEAMEAYRAVRSGAPALLAMALRQGQLGRAWQKLEANDLERALPPGVGARLLQASEDDDPEAWLDLFRVFDAYRRDASAETSLPPYVADAGAFGAALSAYRSSPGQIEYAMPLSMMLVEFGLPTVAAHLLSQSANAESEQEAVSWSVALIINGMMELGRTDQLDAARRMLEEAKPLLQLAEESKRGVSPSPAQVYGLLGSLEIRQGQVERAYPLLEKASRLDPSSEMLIRLAKLSRYRDQPAQALQQIERAVQLAQGHGNLLTEAQAEELRFEVLRGQGKAQEAEEALRRSLRRVLTARDLELTTISRAGIERLLARLLERFGQTRAARRAYERALEASRKNPVEMEITLTDMARAAVTRSDVRLARLATRNAVDLGLPAEDLVYIALWQKLVEDATNTPSDGLSREVLSEAGGTEDWLARLREFGLGRIDVRELNAAADTIPEKTEAQFYAALSAKEDEQKQKLLAQVEASAAIDLIEVQIARDLLAPAVEYELPDKVDVP